MSDFGITFDSLLLICLHFETCVKFRKLVMDIQFRHLSLRLIQEFNKKHELPHILNELNSLDFKAQIINEKHIFEFIETLSKLNVESDWNVLAKLLILIDQLISNQRVIIPISTANKIIKWILNSISGNLEECFFVCEALKAITTVLKFSGNENECCMVSVNKMIFYEIVS
jgi:hypothetical protein